MARPDIVAAIVALTYLGSVALADVATYSTYLILFLMDPRDSPDVDLENIHGIVSGISEFIGHIVMVYLIWTDGARFAIKINVLSILAISVISLVGLNLHAPVNFIISIIITPLLRCLGGGSHTSSFLALTILHRNSNAKIRYVYYYLTGAVIILLQFCGLELVISALDQFNMLPSIVAIICSILAYCVISFIRLPDSEPEEWNEGAEPSVTDPLLVPRNQPQRDIDQPQGRLATLIRGFHENTDKVFSSENRNMRFIIWSLFLLATCRPVLASSNYYFWKRIGYVVQVQNIWSLGLYAFLLPIAVLFLAPRISIIANSTLYLGQVSIIIGVLGAIETGLATNVSLATIGQILNMVGSAAHLSILAFASNFIPDRVAGRVYMVIALVENIGLWIGMGISYPIYLDLSNPSISIMAGSAIYLVCGGIYLVAAILVWSLDPIAEEAIN